MPPIEVQVAVAGLLVWPPLVAVTTMRSGPPATLSPASFLPSQAKATSPRLLRAERLGVDDRAVAVAEADRDLVGRLGERRTRRHRCRRASGVAMSDSTSIEWPIQLAASESRLPPSEAAIVCRLLVHLGDAGDLRELRHLGDHLGVVDRVERILGGELRGHQPQEIVLVHRAGAGRPWSSRSSSAVGHVVGVVDR